MNYIEHDTSTLVGRVHVVDAIYTCRYSRIHQVLSSPRTLGLLMVKRTNIMSLCLFLSNSTSVMRF
jgi:hypothetical protein